MSTRTAIEFDVATKEWLVVEHFNRPGWRGWSVVARFDDREDAINHCARQTIERS